jgi:hypothetical protein
MQTETITGPNRVRPAGGEGNSEERTHLRRVTLGHQQFLLLTHDERLASAL